MQKLVVFSKRLESNSGVPLWNVESVLILLRLSLKEILKDLWRAA